MNFKIIHIDETDSTNHWLRSFCSKENRREGGTQLCSVEKTPKHQSSLDNNKSIVVVAAYQTAGKGCGNNSWESERGKNLTFSMLIHPEEIPANQQFHITEIVSVALCETLEPYIYNKVEIKWPNDIYVGDKKICGILIENRLQGNAIKDSIIGIGLNVNQTAFLSDAPNPVSLKQLTGRDIDREELLDIFLNTFDSVSKRVTVSSDYRRRLYRRSGRYLYKDETGSFEAEMEDVLEDGRLVLLDMSGKQRIYAFKEVMYVI